MNERYFSTLIKEPHFRGEFYAPTGRMPDEGLVFVPSSAGIQDVRERAYARFFAEQGYACLIADAFFMRGVKQCLTDQSLLSDADLYHFARLAHALLAEAGVSRIGIMGTSKGGACAMQAALRQPFLQHQPAFAYHMALCPSAWVQLRNPRALGGPILVLAGELDDFTGTAPARGYAERIKAANPGLRLEFEVIPGAHHAWESKGEVQYLATAARYAEAGFYLEDDGSYTEISTGNSMDEEAFLASLPARASHGAHYGGGTAELFKATCARLLTFASSC